MSDVAPQVVEPTDPSYTELVLEGDGGVSVGGLHLTITTIKVLLENNACDARIIEARRQVRRAKALVKIEEWRSRLLERALQMSDGIPGSTGIAPLPRSLLEDFTPEETDTLMATFGINLLVTPKRVRGRPAVRREREDEDEEEMGEAVEAVVTEAVKPEPVATAEVQVAVDVAVEVAQVEAEAEPQQQQVKQEPASGMVLMPEDEGEVIDCDE